MSGNNRTWHILIILALMVATLYYLLEVRGIDRQLEEVAYVWDLDPDQIAEVRVTAPIAGAHTALRRETGGRWRVTEPISGTAQSDTCLSLVHTLAAMEIRRTIEEPPVGELAAYGLITPAYTIEVRSTDGRLLRLQIGTHYPGGAYFVRREGERAVLLVPDYVVDAVVRILEAPPLQAEPTPTMGVPLVGPQE